LEDPTILTSLDDVPVTQTAPDQKQGLKKNIIQDKID
jgi:hypothetical protein